MKPLTQWRCDVCHEPIESAADGYVTWHTTEKDLREYGFKIIHKMKCDDNEAPASAELQEFLGPDGLTYVLSHLSYGPLKQSTGTPAGPVDMNEFVDFIRRVQVPFYEEARQRFSEQEVREDRYDWNEYLPYMVAELEKLAIRGK